jgi:hypothetical protein
MPNPARLTAIRAAWWPHGHPAGTGRLQMEIADPGRLNRGDEVAFREAGVARDRPVAHIDQRREDIGEARLLVADRAERTRRHSDAISRPDGARPPRPSWMPRPGCLSARPSRARSTPPADTIRTRVFGDINCDRQSLFGLITRDPCSILPALHTIGWYTQASGIE